MARSGTSLMIDFKEIVVLRHAVEFPAHYDCEAILP